MSRFALIGGVVLLAACGADTSDLPQSTTAGTAAGTAAGSTAPASTAGSTTTAAPTTTAAATTTTAAAASLPAAITGKTYVSTSVEGFTLVPGTQVAITFGPQNISAVAGCNTLTSSWALEGNVLKVPQMAATAMACDPPALMDQDTWLGAVLTSSPTLAVAGDDLTITASGATLHMTDKAAANPPQSLEGPTWTVEAINTANASSTLPAGVRPPTLRFQGGTVAVDTGCNTGSGPYTLGNGTVTFGAIATTRAACTNPAGQQVEQQVLAVLNGTATVAIDSDTLTLTNGSNGLTLNAGATGATGATTTTAAG